MASDTFTDWPDVRPRRWRRWIARLFAVLALAACGAGVWWIVQEATTTDPPAPITMQAELDRLEASSEVLAKRLGAFEAGDSTAKAQAALREASADRDAMAAELRRVRATADAPVRGDTALTKALAAHEAYLVVVGQVLSRPRTRAASKLGARARRARAAFAALPEPGGLPRTVRGFKTLAAYARAARG